MVQSIEWQSNKVSTEDAETLSALVKLAQEPDESPTYKGQACERVGVLWLPREACSDWYGGGVEKDPVALDEEKDEITREELRNLHQFNDSIDNFVMHAAPSEKDSTSRALKWPDDDPTHSRLRRGSPFKEMRETLQSVMKPTRVQR